LINAAGGNVARARNDTTSIFDVPLDAFEEALRLNLHGTVIPTFVFGQAMARRGSGTIVNISSMAALQALSGVLAYSVAKAGIDNFTRWMAVEMARKHDARIRVNAIAPGFFLTAKPPVLCGAMASQRSGGIPSNAPQWDASGTEELMGISIGWQRCCVIRHRRRDSVDGSFGAFSGV
jgi:NAD(P)-dependent dehydrogenase (short-subunit alcohol dehydrogenase family)